jgi:hypothetical protein
MRDGRNNDVLRSNLMSARVASLRHAAGCVLSKRPVLRVRREQTRDKMGDPMMLRMPNGQPK